MDSPAARILSLCSGIAGLDLGVHAALRELGLSPRTVCYVEREAYAAAVLAARMEENRLDAAPVWSDLRTFDAESWRGAVDIVIGGYPCQPFSSAGRRLGKDDPRHLWPEVLRVLVESGAPVLFCENVRGHVSKGLGEVLGQLSCFGFDAEWDVFSAEEEGAAHRRERLFILAYRSSFQLWEQQRRSCGAGREGKTEPGDAGQAWTAPNSDGAGLIGDELPRGQSEEYAESSCQGWLSTESPVVRDVHGLPARVDRVRSLGNAVVPACARRAFLELWRRAFGGDS